MDDERTEGGGMWAQQKAEWFNNREWRYETVLGWAAMFLGPEGRVSAEIAENCYPKGFFDAGGNSFSAAEVFGDDALDNKRINHWDSGRSWHVRHHDGSSSRLPDG